MDSTPTRSTRNTFCGEIIEYNPYISGHSVHRKECAVVFSQIQTQGSLTNSLVDEYLLLWIEEFLIDRKARGLAEGTLCFYRIKLKLFSDFCETQVVTQIG
jgi:hypothetical protein